MKMSESQAWDVFCEWLKTRDDHSTDNQEPTYEQWLDEKGMMPIVITAQGDIAPMVPSVPDSPSFSLFD